MFERVTLSYISSPFYTCLELHAFFIIIRQIDDRLILDMKLGHRLQNLLVECLPICNIYELFFKQPIII